MVQYKADVEEKYRSWWIGKKVRLVTQTQNSFKKCIDLEFCSPPSGMVGVVILKYSDGTEENVIHDSFRPRKKDVEILSKDK